MFSIFVKVNVPPDQQSEYIEKIKELVKQSEAHEPRTLSLEFYKNDAGEFIVRDTYQDSEAFLAHLENVGEIVGAMSEIGSSTETLIFGSPNDLIRQRLSALGAQFFDSIAGFTR